MLPPDTFDLPKKEGVQLLRATFGLKVEVGGGCPLPSSISKKKGRSLPPCHL